MTAPGVRLERRGTVAVVTLHDPARRNVLGDEMRSQLLRVTRDLVSGPAKLAAAAPGASGSPRAVVLTGAAGAFSAGGDLSSMPPPSVAAAAARLEEIRTLVGLVRSSPVPWVAAVEGAAAGVALGVATVCDLIVAGRSARFLVPFSRLGLVPDGGLLLSLAERLGAQRAKALLLLGDPVDAGRAVQLGLADEVVDDGTTLERAVEVAATLGERAPGSVAAIRDYYARIPAEPGPTFEFEAQRQLVQYFSRELAEGRAAFAQRRPADFSTTRPALPATREGREP